MAENSEDKKGATKWDALIFLLDKLIDKAHIGTLLIVATFCFLIYSLTRNLESEDSRLLIEQFISALFGGSARSIVIWVLIGTNLLTIFLANRNHRQLLSEIKRLAAFRDAYISYKQSVVESAHRILQRCRLEQRSATIVELQEELERSLDSLPLDVKKRSSDYRLR